MHSCITYMVIKKIQTCQGPGGTRQLDIAVQPVRSLLSLDPRVLPRGRPIRIHHNSLEGVQQGVAGPRPS